mgnify:CR=1 FL=1
MSGSLSIFYFLILIFSIVVHEVAHGLAAEKEGDPTARMLGRITLNPLKHIDWVGSVILPFILIISNAGFVIGWAKPVPYNENNLKRGNKSVAWVAIAGILVNLGLAVLFSILLRVMVATGTATPAIAEIASIVVLVNIMLAFFNAIPLAPLDGFRFLSAVLPRRTEPTMRLIEQYSLPLLFVFIIFGWKVIAPFVFVLFSLLTGLAI